MKIRENAIKPEDYRGKVPFYMFKRVDLRNGVSSLPVPFKTDFGGDFLLKRTVFRWGGTPSQEVNPDPRYLPAPVPEPREPVALNYIELANVRYIDFDSTGTGHAGTDVDPFSFDDWQASLILNILPITFYVKGQVTTALSEILLHGTGERVDYVAWNPSVNGPPRIFATAATVEFKVVAESVRVNGFIFGITNTLWPVDYPVIFQNCYIKAGQVDIIPGRVENSVLSGNTIISATDAVVYNAAIVNNYSVMEADTAPYAAEFYASADRGTMYNMAFVDGSRFTFIGAGTGTHEHTGISVPVWNNMDVDHDYILSLSFTVHNSIDTATNSVKFGLWNGATLLYGIKLVSTKTDEKVMVYLVNNGVERLFESANNRYGTRYKIDFRKSGTNVLIYRNDTYVTGEGYTDTGHAALTSLKPALSIEGGVDGVDEFDVTIHNCMNESLTTPLKMIVDSLISCDTIDFTELFSFNCYFTTPSATYKTDCEEFNCITAALLKPLPQPTDGEEEFLEVKYFFDLISPLLPTYGYWAGYPGYNTGLWGYERRNISALSFSYPEVRYVNLDLEITFGHIGTESDPFSFFDLHTFTGMALKPTLILVRGSHFNLAIYDFKWAKSNLNHVYRAWNFELYGPWRLRTKYGFDMNSPTVLVYDGIICGIDETDTRLDIVLNSLAPQFINCYLIGDHYTTSGLYPFAGTGCLLDFNTITATGFGFKDSLIKVVGLSGAGVVNSWVNCGISSTTNTVPVNNFLNCALDWLPPPFPAWDNPDPMAWHYLDFITNLSSVVFEGADPYTGYLSGIFGLPRLGIGALYFLDNIPVMPSDIKVSLRKMTSIFGVYHDAPPNLFSSPCQFKNCEPVAAPLPVDDYLFNTLYKGSVRLSFKTYNWIVEDNATIVIDIIKENPSLTEPEFIDIIVEGYFLKGAMTQ
jgi:hypothetical protein